MFSITFREHLSLCTLSYNTSAFYKTLNPNTGQWNQSINCLPPVCWNTKELFICCSWQWTVGDKSCYFKNQNFFIWNYLLNEWMNGWMKWIVQLHSVALKIISGWTCKQKLHCSTIIQGHTWVLKCELESQLYLGGPHLEGWTLWIKSRGQWDWPTKRLSLMVTGHLLWEDPKG